MTKKLKRFGVVSLQMGSSFVPCNSPEDRMKNLEVLKNMVECAVFNYADCTPMGVKLVVGGEYSVFGNEGWTVEEVRKNAITIPGPETDFMCNLAKELNIYICPGTFAEIDDTTVMIYNTQLIIGPEGILSAYRKIHTFPTGEASMLTSPHDVLSVGYDTEKYPLFPVVDTEIGRLGGFICYEALFPEHARELAMQGCEIFLGSTAWFDPWGQNALDLWKLTCRSRCVENMAYGIFAGGIQTWVVGGLSESGQSFISDYFGRILAEVTPGIEGWTYATIDLDALRDQRKNVSCMNTLSHLRTDIFGYLENPGFAALPSLKDTAISRDDSIARFKKARKDFWGKFYDFTEEDDNLPL